MTSPTTSVRPMSTAPRWPHALAGLVAGLVLLAVAELLALWIGPVSSPWTSAGSAAVQLAPPGITEAAITLLGTADKPVLLAVIAAVLLLAFAGIGSVGKRRLGLARLLLLLLGAAGAAAVLTRADAGPLDALPTLLGTGLGIAVLGMLTKLAADLGAASPADRPAPAPARREFLQATLSIGALAALTGTAARALGARARRTAEALARWPLPDAVRPAAPPPPGAQVDVEGMPPFLTPADDFYRIDTALRIPQVNPEQWRLRITGLVERPLELSYEDLLAEDLVEAAVTLTCVSNAVGGDLAGNAVWRGVPLARLLERAGVRDAADMVLSRSVDGWTASTPLEAMTDGRDALVALGMNGAALPPVHGFPARLVVPGLYGYVSATKWVTELQLTTYAADTAYWTQRGWAERGPIKTASRIDVPRDGARVAPDGDGAIVLGGTAWAQHRGISAVEVRIDDGPWQRAALGASASADQWRQWSYRAGGLAPGAHEAAVRAITADGEVQTGEPAPSVPDGATGHHTVTLLVEG